MAFLVVVTLIVGWFSGSADAARAPATVAPAGNGQDATGSRSPGNWPAPGVYAFLDWRNIDPVDYPYLTGGHMVFLWDRIEVSPGVFDWSAVDSWLDAEAALGKITGLAFNSYDGQCCGGEWLPEWFEQQHPDGYAVCDGGVVIPRYWSDAYLMAWNRFVQAAAARYDNDPRVAWVEISTGIYGETNPAENNYHDCLASYGLSGNLWVQTVNEITDMYLDAWQNKPLMLQYAPYFDSRIERRQFTDYAGARGVGMKHNKLLVDHDDQVINDPSYYFYRSGQYDPMFTFADQVPMSWEAYRNWFLNESDTYWGFMNGLNKHPTYILVTHGLLSTASPMEQQVLAFAQRYSGRTLADTPSVWTVFRDSLYSWYPQRGNFDFWLYQHDDVPGGQTVPLWNVTNDYRGRYTRRTDGSNGNPYMYFDVDDGYLLGGTNAVSVTVTYLDRGTDRWQLQYDSVADPYAVALEVQKQNTGQWRTVSTLLTDAHFGNRQEGGPNHPGHDFRIWDRGDGNDIFHMVDVARVAGSEVTTIVLQPGANGYDGLTDSYLDSWAPSTNYGDLWRMSLRPDDVWAGALRFDLSGQLPPEASIRGAYLELFNLEHPHASWLDVSVYALRRSWHETEVTWERATGAVPWTEPGANGIGSDRAGMALDLQRVQERNNWVQFDVSQAVREWHNGTHPNYGLVLKGGASDRTVSHDFASAEYGDPGLRPRLVIDYALPAPTPTPTVSPTPVATATPTPSPTPATPPRQITASLASQPPTIDGDLSEWSGQAGTPLDLNTADFVHPRSTPLPPDSSALVWTAWDASTLYVAARIWDDALVADSAEVWLDDGLEIAIDAALDGVFTGVDDHQITAVIDGRVTDRGVTPLPQVTWAGQETDDGFAMEMAVPLSVLQAPVWQAGHVAGFTIGLHDDDDGGTWDAYMVWEGLSTTGQAHEFGRLLLSSTGTTPVATSTPTNTPTATPTHTPTATPTHTFTATPTHTPTATPTHTFTATPTPRPTDTPTQVATNTPTPKPTDTPTQVATSTPTLRPTDTPTPVATNTPTPRPTGTPTPVATNTPTPRPTGTPTQVATNTATPTPTATNTPTQRPTATGTLAPATGAVEGLVFHDRNGNGLPDAGDRLLAGAVVRILREGNLIGQVVTAADGHFAFTGLAPQLHLLEEIDPPGYTSSNNHQHVSIRPGVTALHYFIDEPNHQTSPFIYLPLSLVGRD